MARKNYTKIGTTRGLSQLGMSNDSPEQVYVWIDKDEDAHRPILIEGWHGYQVPMKMLITRDQAKELIPVLLDAVIAGTDLHPDVQP